MDWIRHPSQPYRDILSSISTTYRRRSEFVELGRLADISIVVSNHKVTLQVRDHRQHHRIHCSCSIEGSQASSRSRDCEPCPPTAGRIPHAMQPTFHLKHLKSDYLSRLILILPWFRERDLERSRGRPTETHDQERHTIGSISFPKGLIAQSNSSSDVGKLENHSLSIITMTIIKIECVETRIQKPNERIRHEPCCCCCWSNEKRDESARCEREKANKQMNSDHHRIPERLFLLEYENQELI